MKCRETRTLMSSYLDGAITGRQMHQARAHLDACPECRREYELLGETQRLVAGLRRRKAPPELELRLKLALSHQAAKRRHPFGHAVLAWMHNVADASLMPATAGVLSAIICFGLLIGFFALPAELQASGNDVPTRLYTPPQLRFSPVDVSLGAIAADDIVVEAYIDPAGRVQDYRILSGPKEISPYLSQLNNLLIFTIFRPATSFGQPTTGKAVLSFAKVNVKG